VCGLGQLFVFERESVYVRERWNECVSLLLRVSERDNGCVCGCLCANEKREWVMLLRVG